MKMSKCEVTGSSVVSDQMADLSKIDDLLEKTSSHFLPCSSGHI